MWLQKTFTGVFFVAQIHIHFSNMEKSNKNILQSIFFVQN